MSYSFTRQISDGQIAPKLVEGPICNACAEGDHDQILGRERCSCPCHGSPSLIVDGDVAADVTPLADDQVAA